MTVKQFCKGFLRVTLILVFFGAFIICCGTAEVKKEIHKPYINKNKYLRT